MTSAFSMQSLTRRSDDRHPFGPHARLLALTAVLLTAGLLPNVQAGGEALKPADFGATTVIAERWLTRYHEPDNVDSLAVWSDGGERHWLLATTKESHSLLVYDADTGRLLKSIGGSGSGPGQFLRPNGISVVDDLVWVVERDNRRVQVLQLPSFAPLDSFGERQLEKPYGLWILAIDAGYRVFVTDAYMTAEDGVPADAQLDRRLHRFDVARQGEGLTVSHTALGPTAGAGRLLKVESIFGDPVHGRILVAEEHESRLGLKLFDLEGRFLDRSMATEHLRYEPEGIALYSCPDGSGTWIVTDQDHHDNRFLLYDRQTLGPLGAFTGRTTANTDGVWLHQGALPYFPHGAFYAVHDDGGAAAFDLAAILATIDRAPCADENS